MKKIKILLAEDDRNTAFMLKDNLTQHGYDVFHASDGKQAIAIINSGDFDLALLDVMMPNKNGFQLAEFIKSNHRSLPIVFITARNLIEDRIHGYKIGCDDYISKPFHMEELYLRLNVVLRRNNMLSNSSKNFVMGDVSFDLDINRILYKHIELSITPKESKIWEVFLTHFDRTLPRDFILERVWGVSNLYTSRGFDVYLNKIRKQLKEIGHFEIVNAHSIGFKLTYKGV